MNRSSRTPTRPRPAGWFWKTVFWLSLSAYLMILVAFTDLLAASVSEIADVALTAILFLAVYGIIYHKPLGPKVLWQVAFPLFVIGQVLNSIVLPALGLLPYAGDNQYGALGPIEESLFALFFSWCFYKYAFGSKEIWHKGPDAVEADRPASGGPPP